MRVALVKSHSGVCIAATDEDRIKLRAMRAGEAFVVTFKKARDIKLHRKVMACIAFAGSRWPRLAAVRPDLRTEAAKLYLKERTGHMSYWTSMVTGEVSSTPKSLAFEDVDQGEFISWFEKAKPVLVEMFDEWSDRSKAKYEGEIDGWVAWLLS